MSASNTDKFRKATNNFSTTLSGAIGASDTTITLASVTNLPTDTGIDLVIDRVNSSGVATPTLREYVKGTVSSSNIINLVRGLGNSTAQSHATGAVVEQVFTGEGISDLVSGLLIEHNQDGTHGAITSTNATLTTPTISAPNLAQASTGLDAILQASGVDTNINLNLKPKGTGSVFLYDGAGNKVFDPTAWISYTPTITGFSANPTGGIYRYRQLGKTVILSICQPTNGTSNSASFTISLPVAAATIASQQWIGNCSVTDNSVTATVPGLMNIQSAGTTVGIYKDWAGNGFTASGNKRCPYGTIIYEAA